MSLFNKITKLVKEDFQKKKVNKKKKQQEDIPNE